MGGSNTSNQRGVYGEKGVPNSENYPGSRYGALALYDSCSRTFMMFGGNGYDERYSGVCFTTD